MGGRGRGHGRGRGGSINIEALGLAKGDKESQSLPPLAQPPPLYPPLLFKPVPWQQSSDLDYMLALKQELRESFHKSPFYIKAPNKVKDIERYSDKYQPGSNDNVSSCLSDWTRVPYELREHPRKRVKVNKMKPDNKVAKPDDDDDDDVSKLLEKLEQNDAKLDTTENAEANEEDNDEEKKEGENEEVEEEYDEEDAEEETDYNQAYFDNGEEYGDDDEDDDEPTY